MGQVWTADESGMEMCCSPEQGHRIDLVAGIGVEICCALGKEHGIHVVLEIAVEICCGFG